MLATMAEGGNKLADAENGMEMTKCISITDFQEKTLHDEITLVDKVDGCCPAGSVPGQKFTVGYKGAQVVCGWKADGTIAISTGSSNGKKTCTYNKCYVDKQDLACADGSKQFLNGCCQKATGPTNKGFPALCLSYYSSFNNVWGEKVQYCTTYHKNYGTLGRKGTKDKTDDQKDGKLVPSMIDTYTPCAGGSAGSGGSSTGKASGVAQIVSSFSVVAALIGWHCMDILF